jgi:hypothetical protein
VNGVKLVTRESGAPTCATACVLAIVCLFVAGCSQVELEGRPLRQGEQTTHISVKNPFDPLGWDPNLDTEITSVHFEGRNETEGYKGYWSPPLFSNCGDFYLPAGQFFLEVWYYRLIRTWYYPGLESGSEFSRWSDWEIVNIEAGNEYVITPAGFFSREEWEKKGRPLCK